MREEFLVGFGVPFDNLGRHKVVSLDRVVEIIYGGYLEITPMFDTSSFP